jgi:hypothetical protein
MTHTLTGLIAATAAACFAAGAVAAGGPLAARANQLPANEYETFTLSATGATYLSPTTLTEVTGASVTINDIIKPSNSSYPSLDIWRLSEITEDTTRHVTLEPETRILVFDDNSAQLINCCGGNINGNGLIQQSGIVGYAFPVGTARQTYQVFDTVTDAPEPATYTGTDTVGGIGTDVFTENLTAVKAGVSALSPSRAQLYTVHRCYWVDPETGLVLKISQDEDLYLAGPGSPATLLKAALSMPAATVAKLARQDASHRNRMKLLAMARLVCLCLAVALALLAGWLLIPWPGRRRRPGPPGAPPASGSSLPPGFRLTAGERLPSGDQFPRRGELSHDGRLPPRDP